MAATDLWSGECLARPNNLYAPPRPARTTLYSLHLSFETLQSFGRVYSNNLNQEADMSEVRQLITHTESKAVLVTPELEAALPGVRLAFEMADGRFIQDPRGYLDRLEESQFSIKTEQGPEVACSLLMNNGQQAEELMVVFAPFADRSPKSSAATMYRYIDGRDQSVGKTKSKPNTWSQTTKSAVTTDVLQAVGHGMPVLTIYAPVPTHAHSNFERELFRYGSFTASGRVAMEALRGAIEQTQLLVHGMDSPQQFYRLHLSGASLGASNAIGAAAKLMARDFDIKSVTAQELVMSPKNLLDLAKRFTVGGIVGEASTATFPADAKIIGESALRQAIDYKGSEIIGMNLRMLQGASKLAYMKGLTKPQPTIDAIETLLDHNVSMLVATADNSALSDRTRTLLPGETPQLHISAQEGAQIGHIVDEHVALSALVIALNVAKRA